MLQTSLKACRVALLLFALLGAGAGIPSSPVFGALASDPAQPATSEKNLDQLRPLVRRLGALSVDLAQTRKGDAAIVDALFAATLVRLPKEAERATATKHLRQEHDRTKACRDLAWSLLNSREFLKLHDLDRDIAKSLRLLNALSAELDGRPTPEKPKPKEPPSNDP
jgi:hypothetical protein